MSRLTEQQEDRLRELLAGRADRLHVPEPYPPVPMRVEGVASGSRSMILAIAAVIALLAFGSFRLLAAGPPVPSVGVDAAAEQGSSDPEQRWEGSVGLLVFTTPGSASNTVSGINTKADEIIGQVDALGASMRFVQTRRNITEQEFNAFWAGSPEVEADRPTTWPVSFRVRPDSNSDSDVAALVSELTAIDGVVRVEPYPGCGDGPSLVTPDCDGSDRRIRDFAIAAGAALAILAVLVRAGRLPLRILVAISFVVVSAGLVFAVVRPVGVQLDRAAPAVAEIRSQFGSDLSCEQWYDLEADTRRGHLDGADPRFENIDPGLVKTAIDDGTDIYLWPLWVVPALFAITIMLAIAWFLPLTQRWKVVIRIAIAVVVLAGVVSLPIDFRTDRAVQCMSE